MLGVVAVYSYIVDLHSVDRFYFTVLPLTVKMVKLNST